MQSRGRDAANRLTWDEFKKLLKDEYCPRSEIQKLEAELWNHKMKGNDVDSYTAHFHELAKLVPHLVMPEENRVDRYVWGLSLEIRGNAISADPKTLQEAANLATKLTNNANRSGEFASDKARGERKIEEPIKRKSGGRLVKEQKVSGNFGMQTQAIEKGQGMSRNVTSAIIIISEDALFFSGAIREAILRRIVETEGDESVMNVEVQITFGTPAQG